MRTSEEPVGQPIVSFAGERVALGPLRRDLVPLYLRWVNDLEVLQTLTALAWPITLEAEEAWYERMSTSETSATFTLYERDGLRPIGTTGLANIDRNNRTAVFGILIGEKDCWGRGYGTEATRLVLDYAFTGMGLHSVWLWAQASNERGLRAYRRAGFREIGRRRQAHRRGSEFEDLVLMDCLASEFESPVLRQFLMTRDPGGPVRP
jgi:RimJ/RimL family protein N-acetyltransferase